MKNPDLPNKIQALILFGRYAWTLEICILKASKVTQTSVVVNHILINISLDSISFLIERVNSLWEGKGVA